MNIPRWAVALLATSALFPFWPARAQAPGPSPVQDRSPASDQWGSDTTPAPDPQEIPHIDVGPPFPDMDSPDPGGSAPGGSAPGGSAPGGSASNGSPADVAAPAMPASDAEPPAAAPQFPSTAADLSLSIRRSVPPETNHPIHGFLQDRAESFTEAVADSAFHRHPRPIAWLGRSAAEAGTLPVSQSILVLTLWNRDRVRGTVEARIATQRGLFYMLDTSEGAEEVAADAITAVSGLKAVPSGSLAPGFKLTPGSSLLQLEHVSTPGVDAFALHRERPAARALALRSYVRAYSGWSNGYGIRTVPGHNYYGHNYYHRNKSSGYAHFHSDHRRR